MNIIENNSLLVILISEAFLFLLFWLFVCFGVVNSIKALHCKRLGKPHQQYRKAAGAFYRLTSIIVLLGIALIFGMVLFLNRDDLRGVWGEIAS